MPASAEARARQALSWGLFAVGYTGAFLASSLFRTPLLWYFPLERRFSVEVRPQGLAADFYGRVLLCLAAGGCAFLIARVSFRGASTQTCDTWTRRAIGWSAVLLVFSAGLYAFMLWHRVLTPAPLPPGYLPR